MGNYYLYGTLSVNSIFHFLFPMTLGYILRKKWMYGVFILILFELFENLSGFTLVILGWDIVTPEPLINIISDLVIGTAGLFAGYNLWLKK